MILFSKQSGKCFRISKNTGERALSGVYVHKISSIYLDKCPSFGVLKVENGQFSRYFQRLLHFPEIKICPIWAA